MPNYYQQIFLYFLLFLSCDTGKLTVVANLPTSLKEISACETTSKSDLIWMIEDAGNKNNLYGIDKKGNILKELDISNANNIDWEELTSDNLGNLYIGDFGNNAKKRKLFTIYKISNPEKATEHVKAEIINFKLPKNVASKDFEAFFIFQNQFYIFSKENKKGVLISVPNKEGTHTAKFSTDFNLKGKKNKITSADISDDGKTIVLLNHDKLWMLTDFKKDHFFDGTIKALKFEHSSQKEGICFIDNSTVYITDERKKSSGGNLYRFELN